MIFEHYSKNKKVLSVIFASILLIGFAFLFWQKPADKPLSKEIKPVFENSQIQPASPGNNFPNPYMEKAVTDYLLTQKQFSWKTQSDSYNFCTVEKLKPEQELFPLYLWAYCGEYAIQDGKLKILSGSSGPVKIDYPNEMSYYDLSKFSHEAPGDGSQYGQDIERIFPEDIQQKIFNFDRKNIIEKTENSAFSEILAWEEIKQAIGNCEAQSVWQTHDKTVKAELKNGKELSAVEPEIDAIINIARSAEEKCGKILTGTE